MDLKAVVLHVQDLDPPVLMEDSRFKRVKSFKKAQLPPVLQWLAGQEYFVDEMIGIYSQEMESFKKLTNETFDLFVKATDHLIQNNHLDYLGIPKSFQSAIIHSWENRADFPFFAGRFDFNGGVDGLGLRVIEFNADTFSTLPETILWQKMQNREAQSTAFNFLEDHLITQFKQLKQFFNFEEIQMVASSLGHPEDIANCNTMLMQAHQAGLQVLYKDLTDIIFSEEEGLFYELGNEEFQPIDIWFKMIPWDWMFEFEPELAHTLIKISQDRKAIVLNPLYTTLWQNKKFLSYITEKFPNSLVAETYNNQNRLQEYVKKPIYGRIGENIEVKTDSVEKTDGDYENQPCVYQKYYPLPKDEEGYSYQFGMFYSDQPLAFNVRHQDSKIINDECEFISHFLI
ncbi:hypothetical protein ETU09_02955 [Apibacter muscae]|uniref:Glutathionylspermidine synthase pre-ATP-grasp-like domain-containing protein n=1 Tax=Apibacter muscae TaxID=2509004 RepID=A0A563DGY3_9FLAO|nr:glutathionylspermidine synthase family protein [Apibacter muscae]TWP29420.1 hypothetical protein ETU09_02955 [Apibacter muscae]